MKPLNKTTYRIEQSLESYSCGCTSSMNCPVTCSGCINLERLVDRTSGITTITSNSSTLSAWASYNAPNGLGPCAM